MNAITIWLFRFAPNVKGMEVVGYVRCVLKTMNAGMKCFYQLSTPHEPGFVAIQGINNTTQIDPSVPMLFRVDPAFD